ncbi:alpha/beta fold hydrolase [Stenotrophomonas sp. NA06056]|uniref:alpha/beta hydrolase family protein n=1 Tax=Stenotrophomonas sp. NA06056 TaxID=2742129 RepID=UPI00158967C4|nr:alpha/beta fold hydrolase [Stenotrophomonas sp. NA06056]QKW58998.1 alpha/beta hydrolase [Stenotrophomonas sp. NA06056]
MRSTRWILTLLLASLAPMAIAATPIVAGERHGETTLESAAIRDGEHRDVLRFTVWYPAAPGSEETPLSIGPADALLFEVGRAAKDAPIAEGRLPTLLLSHGNGGTARMMGWLGTALARAGYLVIAVDHPGNNGADEMTLAGSVLTWLRADDLKAALAAVQADTLLGPHVDASRLGVIGYSAGGFTALLSAGARPDMARLLAFCHAHPDDGVCRPQQEAATHTMEARLAAAASPQLQPYVRHAQDDRSIPGVRAVFVLAPAIVQAFAPEQLKALQQPVAIVLGAVDDVAPPATNGDVAAELIPKATLHALPDVGHYDFLSTCTPLAKERLPALCVTAVPKEQTHGVVVEDAVRFFGEALR